MQTTRPHQKVRMGHYSDVLPFHFEDRVRCSVPIEQPDPFCLQLLPRRRLQTMCQKFTKIEGKKRSNLLKFHYRI